MDCPRCYIPKTLRDDYYTAGLNVDYLSQTLKHTSIGQSNKTVAIYMGGEASAISEKQLRTHMNVVTKELPDARHTIVTNLLNLPKWLITMSLKEFAGQIETTYANGKKQTLSGSEYRYQKKFVRNLTAVTSAGINCTVNVELNIETIDAGIEPIINIMKESRARDWAFDYSVDFDEFNYNPVYDEFDYPVLTGSATLKEYWDFVNAIKQNEWVINNKVRVAPRSDGFNVLEGKSFLTINANNTVTTNPLFSTMNALQYSDINAINQSKIRERHERAAISRIRSCVGCNEFYDCQGFSSHMPIQQNGVCAGGLECN
jgi:MoaA/NifB/PqqE/SkfB family radical SAM enzyme